MSVSIREFSAVNRARGKTWHDKGEPWSGADWSNAMCGEAGEAANVVKKLRRGETGTASPRDPGTGELRSQLADEIGDVVAYLDLLADHYDLDLQNCIVHKFNLVSVREGFEQFIVKENA